MERIRPLYGVAICDPEIYLMCDLYCSHGGCLLYHACLNHRSETHFDDKIGSIVNEFQLMKERSGPIWFAIPTMIATPLDHDCHTTRGKVLPFRPVVGEEGFGPSKTWFVATRSNPLRGCRGMRSF
nr:hypothetical protein M569_00237 [Ipomoea batatas]